jgi:protocatechuate 3,4-dioxygenase beta subunit
MQPRTFFVLAPLAFAVLLGTVNDRTTGQPLAGVTVSVGNARATTHADGSYRLTKVKPGAATLTASSDDVPPQQFTLTIGATTTRHDLRVCSTTLDYSCAPQ